MKRILVIDDDEQSRGFLVTILTDEGYLVESVANGKLGLAAMAASDFDLVITDIFMPETDGLEVLREMNRIHSKVKVICMSGGGRGIFPTEALLFADVLGAQKAIQKPFTKKELMPMVCELLEESPE